MTVTSIPWTKGPGLTDDTDHSLVKRAFAGDREAFAQVVAVHQVFVARLAQRLLGWDPQIEDIVQDVFASAWQRRAQLREPDRVRSWLATITVNTTRNRLRRRKLRRALLLNAAALRRLEPCEVSRVGESLERDEVGRQVREAMNKLPQRDKEVLVLRYLENMSVKEAAEALGQNVSAVTGRLHRARKRLAERLPKELRP